VSKYIRNGRWTIRVPHPFGGVVPKSIGTGDSRVAGNYETMCDVLLARPLDHVFLLAVCAGNLKLRRLYSHWVRKTMEELRAEVTDIDLTAHLASWRTLLVREFGEPTLAQHTARKYTDAADWFFTWAGGFQLSHLTPQKVTAWMASRGVSSSTERRYWAALQSLADYLVRMRVIEANPLDKLDAPRANDPRTRHLTPGERDALIDATEDGPARIAEVLAHMGLEVSAILAARVSDVDIAARTVYAHGTKHRRGRTNYRSRVTKIPTWALAHLKAAVRLKHPSTLLVPFAYSMLRRRHYEACERAGITDYRIHDGRHTYAVFMKKAGTPSEVIGLQLGHKDGQQVEKVYGRYQPTSEELARWTDVAERHHARGTT